MLKGSSIKMKNKAIITLMLLATIALTSCKGNENNSVADSSNQDYSTSSQITTSAENETENTETSPVSEQNAQTTEEHGTYTSYEILSFSAIQGAVITDLKYNDKGYLSSCSYSYKCEACGTVQSGIHGTYSSDRGSFICQNCGNNQKVEVKAIEDWVEIPY
jgi:hypothetical protein